MKTSALRLKSAPAADRSRSAVSFAIAAALYVPIVAAALWSIPQSAYRAAGEAAAVSLAFSQFAGASPPAPSPEPKVVPDPPVREPRTEDAPEPPQPSAETIPEPTPMPAAEPAPKLKPTPKPEPVPKPKPKPKPAAKPESKPKHQSVQTQAPAAKPLPAAAEAAPEPPKPNQTAQALPSAATAASLPGAASASDDRGIATLIVGESHDPFLAEVKQLVERALEYPRRARMLKIEGVATLEFAVSASGALSDLVVWSSSGRKELDKAAVRAVRRAAHQWSAPQKSVRLRFPIRFEIR